MKKNVAIAFLLLIALALAFLALRTQLRIVQVKGNAATIIQLRDSALTSTNVAQIVEDLDYILWLTPSRDGKSNDRDFAILLDTLTDQATGVMIARLKQITGRDLGPNPKAWIGFYINKQDAKTAPKGTKQ